MAINTNGVSASLTRATPQGPAARAGAAPASATAAETRGERTDSDRISITGTADTLGKLEAAIASLPDVDTARVERVRNAIARGEYVMDSNRVAEKMIALERMLGAKV